MEIGQLLNNIYRKERGCLGAREERIGGGKIRKARSKPTGVNQRLR